MRPSHFLAVMAALAPAAARADNATAAPRTLLLAAAVFPGLGAPGRTVRPMSPLLQPASPYCRRDCRVCRSHCYARFRVHCYAHHCRQDFVLCMRHCWQDICRWC